MEPFAGMKSDSASSIHAANLGRLARAATIGIMV